MQEKFKLTAKKAAAISTSIAMLGMTLTGALAADLSDYPAPFDGDDTVIIFGDDAGNNDNAAAADVALGLPSTAASTSVYTPTPAVSSDYEKWEDLPINVEFNDSSDGFGNTVDADDVEGFQDTTIDIDIDEVDDDYDIRDEIRFAGTDITTTNILRVHTALSFDQDEDWQDRVFIPMRQNSWGYFYVFEDNLREGNYINDSDTDDEIEVEFLGKRFEIEGTTNNAAKLVVNIGQRFYMEAGDTVVVDGKEVTLVQTSATTATVMIDGVREVVTQNDEEIINSLEVRVEDISSDEGIEYDSATLFVGEDARDTFDDGEEFVGEDEDDPAWVWRLAGLTGATPTIGIRWHLNLDDPDEDENPLYQHPIYEGESICLPFDYACLVFDSLQIDDYQDYEIETDTTEDLYFSVANSTNNVPDVTDEVVLQFRAVGSSDDGFLACNALVAGATVTACTVDGLTTETDTISLAVLGNSTAGGLLGASASLSGLNGTLGVFREEQDGSDAILTHVVARNTVADDVFQVEYRDSVISVGIDATNGYPGCAVGLVGPSQANWTIYMEPETRGQNISVYFETFEDNTDCANTEHNDIRYLGHSDSDTVTARDVVYGVLTPLNALANTASYDISGFEEDTRAENGVIIVDPESHQSSDDFEFRVPSDLQDFKANIAIRTSGAAGTSSAVAIAGSSSALAPVKDSEVADVSMYNAIVVGGPAVNTVAADLLGLEYPTYGTAAGVNPGEAVLQLVDNGDKVALLAYGYEADDTRRAGLVLKNSEDFALSGSSMTVRGESLEVSGITVA